MNHRGPTGPEVPSPPDDDWLTETDPYSMTPTAPPTYRERPLVKPRLTIETNGDRIDLEEVMPLLRTAAERRQPLRWVRDGDVRFLSPLRLDDIIRAYDSYYENKQSGRSVEIPLCVQYISWNDLPSIGRSVSPAVTVKPRRAAPPPPRPRPPTRGPGSL